MEHEEEEDTRVVRNLDESNEGSNKKIFKQGLTSDENLTIMLLGIRDSCNRLN